MDRRHPRRLCDASAGNWGELRLYVLVGLGVGLLLYFQTLSSLVIWALAGAFHGIGHVLSTLVFGLFKVVAHPFLLIGGALRPFGRRRGWSGFLSRAASFPPCDPHGMATLFFVSSLHRG